MNENKPHTRTQISQTIKVLALVFALILGYLFALNGRYIKLRNDYYFDKWTKTIILIEKFDTIE